MLSLLSQTNCEGIRFYFGRRKKSQWKDDPKYSKYEGPTLVAVGVDEKNKDLGTGGGYIIDDLLGKKRTKTKSAAAAAAAVKGSETKVVEIVPPEP